MYETLTYQGGVHKTDELKELIEDLGGFILQENTLQMELIINMAVPLEDVDKVEKKTKEIYGEITSAPMAGCEVAIVSPTLARHHLPHAACDISEYLRRYGVKDNMIGLARGHGKGTAGISEYEKDLIEEHDIAIFALGSFHDCIVDKSFLFEDINIPVIVTGAPEVDLKDLPGADAYVSGLGRIPRRLKRGPDIRALKRLVEVCEDLINKQRKDLAQDPPLFPSIMVKNEIETQVSAINDVMSPTPVTSQLNGLRVKLDYDKYHEDIADVMIEDKRLGDISIIEKSHMYDYTLVRLLNESSLV